MLIMIIGYLLAFIMGCLLLLKLSAAIFLIVQGMFVLLDKNKWIILIGCASLKLLYGRCELTVKESETYSSVKSEMFVATVQITTISVFLSVVYKIIRGIVSI